MTLWLWFALGAAVAAGIVLWRLLRGDSRAVPPDDDLEANRALHLEKLALLRRQRDDGEISEERCRELELEYQRQFLADNPVQRSGRVERGGRWAVVVAALLVPVVAAVLYTQLGAQGELRLRSLLERRAEILSAEQPDRDALNAVTSETLDNLSRLAARHPDRPLYPVLQARLYQERGDYSRAADSYRKALVLAPEDAGLRAEYAQVLFSEAGNRMTPEVMEAARKAVELDPDNPSALGLLGIAGFQSGELESAIRYWERALQQVPSGSPTARAMRRGIAAARESLGEEAPAPTSADGASLQVRVEAEGVEAPPDATVFVYAREWQGAPMPLAIQRLSFADLPARVTLDDSMAMRPGAGLSSVGQVEIVARVSLSGDAAPTSGDLQGTLGPVTPGEATDPLRVTIDQRIQ